MPRATLYHHFRGKNAVLDWLLQSTVDHLGVAVADAAAQPGTARDRLAGVIGAVMDIMAEYPEACRVLIGNLEQSGAPGDLVEELRSAFHRPVADLLAEGAQDASLRAVEDPTITASVIFGVVAVSGLEALIVQGNLGQLAVGSAVIETVLTGLDAGS